MIDQQTVQRLLHYDSNSGFLVWRETTSNRTKVGCKAGWLGKNGYWYVGLNGEKYLVSRIIWLYMTGRWPADQIDHRDTDPKNNRWDNLREATRSQNEMNKAVRPSVNTSGIKGVVFDKNRNKWSADIKANGRRYRLGRFPTKEDAVNAYQKAAEKYHGDYARN